MRKTSEKGRNLHRARFSPLTGLLLLLSFFLLDGASTSVAQTPPQQVKIAYASSGINYADWFLAKEKGYFREEGLEPQFIQMRSSIAINAGVTGELHGQASIGSAIRAIQRGAPLRVVAVTLRRPLYWLVVRPEYRSVKELKGKVLGITTIGGSQHTRAKGMLALGGLDPEKDITSVQISDQTTQLQALAGNAVQITALSPPWVAVARDKFKMNILDSAMERFAGIDSGLVVSARLLQERTDLVKTNPQGEGEGQPLFFGPRARGKRVPGTHLSGGLQNSAGIVSSIDAGVHPYRDSNGGRNKGTSRGGCASAPAGNAGTPREDL